MARTHMGFITPPLLSIASLVMGMGFFTTFISVKLDQSGASDAVIGIVLSLYFLGQLIGAFIVEPLFRFVGHIRAFAASASITAIASIVMALDDSYALWSIMRFMAGFALAVQYIVVESWLLAVGTKKTRGTILSIYMIVLYLSLAFSQLILTLIDITTTQAFLVSALFSTLAVIPICFSPHKSPEVPEVNPFTIKELVCRSPFGFMGSLLSGALVATIYGFVPVFAMQYQIPVAWLMFTTLFGAIFLQWPLGKLSDIFDRRKILILCNGLLVIPSVLMWLFPTEPWFILLLSFFIGGLTFSIYPLSVTEVCDHFDSEHVVAIATALLIAYEIGSVVGPLIIPFVSLIFGISGIYLFLAVVAFLLFLFGIGRALFAEKVPLEEQQDFVPLPRVTPVAYELDPRSDER